MLPLSLEEARIKYGNLHFTVYCIEGGYYRILDSENKTLEKRPDTCEVFNASCLMDDHGAFSEVVTQSSTLSASCLPVTAPVNLFKTPVDRPVKQTKPFTHFLSLPLESEHFKARVNEWINTLLSKKNAYGVHKKMFLSTGKLHLTLCMLHLSTCTKIIECSTAIKALEKDILELFCQQPLTLDFHGINTWKPQKKTSHKETVLFTSPTGSSESLNQLQALYRLVSKKLLHEKLIDTEYLQSLSEPLNNMVQNPLKNRGPFWHATILNTKYSRQKLNLNKVHLILNDFSNISFGSAAISQLHLSCLQPTQTCISVPNYYNTEMILKFF